MRALSIESAEEFVRLRSSDDPSEYQRASHEESAASVWLDVIREHPEMRFWVAQNKTVPLTVLAVLARDSDVRVRSMVAMKRKLDDELFTLLAADADEGVRASVARNPKTPSAIIEALCQDPDALVSEAALSRLGRA